MRYNAVLRILRKNRPRPDSPDHLIENIMHSIIHPEAESKLILHIKVSPGHWRLIQAARTVISIAALFLMVFFVIEQHGIKKKLNELESNPASSLSKFSAANAQPAIIQQIGGVIDTYIPIDSLQDMVQINRRSMHYLMSRIRELEAENMSFREKLLQYYSDSTINKN